MIRAAVLTISDSSFEGRRPDDSGPAVRQRLEQCGFQVAVAEVLPDDCERIAERLRALAESGEVAVILTTGGTGVAARDFTPEATRGVIEREIPGLGETMRAEGRKHTPLAALSRGLAGTRGRALIVNLPGSPKGAVESLDAIVKLLPHIVDLLHGKTAHPAELKPGDIR
ncbi:MAG: MogA/MoaB family molybdenum cofactor biosynthesis protein [Acidobacteria bacterium]|nr:MogA/MoaB family molybdenum cofactor biosynthesis protein [Acidobacteriota bacterium]